MFFWPLRYYQQIYCQIYPLLPGGSSSPLPDPVWVQEGLNSLDCVIAIPMKFIIVSGLHALLLEISFPVSLSKTVLIVFHVLIFSNPRERSLFRSRLMNFPSSSFSIISKRTSFNLRFLFQIRIRLVGPFWIWIPIRHKVSVLSGTWSFNFMLWHHFVLLKCLVFKDDKY